MSRLREAHLQDGRVVYGPTTDLPLLAKQNSGIQPNLNGLYPFGEDLGLKSLELFAGAGGLALGTAEAGLSHKVVIEWDEHACRTLRRNHADGIRHVCNWKIIQGDVKGYDFLQHYGEIAFISGGPPCQPFSIGGKHRGQNDGRNMFPHAVRAVREIRPLAFMFENVRGLLRENFSRYFGYIIHQLRYPTVLPRGDEEWTDHLARLERLYTAGEPTDLNYKVVFQLVNAVNFGVPQHRWRVFVVGVRADLGVEFAFPQQTHSEDALMHDMWVSGNYWDRHEVPKRNRPVPPTALSRRINTLRTSFREMMGEAWRTVRDATCDLPSIASQPATATIANHYLNPGARSYPGHTGSPLDEPAKALKAGDHGVPGGENMLRKPDGEVRYFSVRECGRLQCFPDNWYFEGSWTESMRQLGNAVPVKLAVEMATPLVSLLKERAKRLPSSGKRR